MAKHHPPQDEDGALAALANQLDELRRDHERLTTVRGDVAAIRSDLAAFNDALNDLTDTVRRRTASPHGPEAPAQTPDDAAAGPLTDDGRPTLQVPETDDVPEWMAVTDPQLAVAWLNDLTVWVPRVWARYPHGGLPKCWPWHPPAVAELLTSRHQWAAATAPGSGIDGLTSWHDRWRPGTVLRLAGVMSGCERAQGCHTNVTMKHWRYDLDQLDDLAVWWATTSGNPSVDLESAPGLTHEPVHPDRVPSAIALSRGGRR
jgi:hypothetical protein